MMIRYLQYLFLTLTILVVCESRPQQNGFLENSQELNLIEIPDADDLRNVNYDSPQQGIYASPTMDRLQMLIAQYKPFNYQRASNWNMPRDDLRGPEMKRQARYRQCYFNPISCFKK